MANALDWLANEIGFVLSWNNGLGTTTPTQSRRELGRIDSAIKAVESLSKIDPVVRRCLLILQPSAPESPLDQVVAQVASLAHLSILLSARLDEFENRLNGNDLPPLDTIGKTLAFYLRPGRAGRKTAEPSIYFARTCAKAFRLATGKLPTRTVLVSQASDRHWEGGEFHSFLLACLAVHSGKTKRDRDACVQYSSESPVGDEQTIGEALGSPSPDHLVRKVNRAKGSS